MSILIAPRPGRRARARNRRADAALIFLAAAALLLAAQFLRWVLT